MAALKLSDELAIRIQTEAQERGLSVEDFLLKILQRERTLAARSKVEQEQNWWLSRPLRERAKYEGEYVAIHDRQLVDHDKDERALLIRIGAKYGRTPVLLIPAEGPRDINIHSPHLEQR